MPRTDLLIKNEFQADKKVAIVRLEGQLNTHSVDDLNEVIQEHLAAEHFRLVFDLGKVQYIGSTCVGAFIAAAATVNEQGGTIIIVNPSLPVKTVFDSFGISDMFVITTDVPTAVASLG